MPKFVMHSYTFRSYPVEEAFANAERFGWEGIELQPCHFARETIEQDVAYAMELSQKHDIPITCFDFGNDFINEDPKVIEHSVAVMENDIALCARHGIPIMNGGVGVLMQQDNDWGKNGSALATEQHYERAAEAFRHLGKVAARHNIRIVFEIHMNTIHDTISSMAKLLDLIGLDNVMANPDPGNMFGTSTAEKDASELEKLEGRIGYFHFKNCREHDGKYDYSVKLADGHIDLSKWVAQLVKMGYDEPVCVEYCGAGDPHVAAEKDIQYLRNTFAWVQR